MDFTRLGKLMPDDAEVFEELQQAARRCLDSPEAGPKVCMLSHNVLWQHVLELLLSVDLSKAFMAKSLISAKPLLHCMVVQPTASCSWMCDDLCTMPNSATAVDCNPERASAEPRTHCKQHLVQNIGIARIS